ncbi:MAG: hypothetical protein ACLTZM_20115 [Ruminococcus sp.]
MTLCSAFLDAVQEFESDVGRWFIYYPGEQICTDLDCMILSSVMVGFAALCRRIGFVVWGIPHVVFGTEITAAHLLVLCLEVPFL